MYRRILPALGTLALAIAGCSVENPAYVKAPSTCPEDEFPRAQRFQIADPGLVDILLVVDNGPGMDAMQTALSDAMPAFVEALNSAEWLDWQVGVTTTDMSNDLHRGRLQHTASTQPGCQGDLPTLIRRDTPNAGVALACNVIQGTSGDVIGQGLASAQAALRSPLTDEGGPNGGFARSGARLVVVFFSNEDDCSSPGGFDTTNPNNCVWNSDDLIGVDEFARTFRSISGRSGEPISIVAITGPSDGRTWFAPTVPEPSCQSLGRAYAGDRYLAMAEQFGARGQAENICSPAYAQIFESIVQDQIFIEGDPLCIARRMSGAPTSVLLRRDETSSDILQLSEYGDFLSVGPTSDCENGVVSIAASPHRNSPYQLAEIRFCTADPTP